MNATITYYDAGRRDAMSARTSWRDLYRLLAGTYAAREYERGYESAALRTPEYWPCRTPWRATP